MTADQPARCPVCGRELTDTDPLVKAEDPADTRRTWWIHRSHTVDPRSGFYGTQVTR